MSKVTVDGNKLVAAIGVENAREILDIMSIDLNDVNETLLDASCKWRCGVEGKLWLITAKQLTLTDEYAVRWTETDEAGINDVEIIERVDDESDSESLGEWMIEIAIDAGFWINPIGNPIVRSSDKRYNS